MRLIIADTSVNIGSSQHKCALKKKLPVNWSGLKMGITQAKKRITGKVGLTSRNAVTANAFTVSDYCHFCDLMPFL
jgi:hypothetical protein